jgi:hypothetical protein
MTHELIFWAFVYDQISASHILLFRLANLDVLQNVVHVVLFHIISFALFNFL